MPRSTAAEVDQVKALIAKGMKPAAIAKRLGADAAAVRAIAYRERKAAGKSQPKPDSGLHTTTYEIIAALLGGMTQSDVARAYNLPRQRVSAIAAEIRKTGLHKLATNPDTGCTQIEALREQVATLQAETRALTREKQALENFKKVHEEVLAYAEKHGVDAAAAKFELSHAAVYAKIRKFGQPQAIVPSVTRSMAIIAMAIGGKSNEAIATRLDIPTIHVERVIDRARKGGVWRSIKRLCGVDIR